MHFTYLTKTKKFYVSNQKYKHLNLSLFDNIQLLMKNHTLSLLEKKLQAIIDSNKCKFNEDDQDSSDGEA